MCLAVCNRKLGGCGYIGDDLEWTEEATARLCPVCGCDIMYFIHDYNLEAVVDNAMIEKVRDRLDKYYASLGGKSLHIAYRSGNISSHRLTPEIKRKIGLIEEFNFS
jgi:hypothetical protein